MPMIKFEHLLFTGSKITRGQDF